MKETTIDQTLVLCDLDSLLLDAAGNLPQLQRDVLQLFASRGGRLTVFSQRSPRAVRSLLGGVRLSAPALVCGGTLAYNFSEGSGTALCSFEGMEESVLKMLPSLSGVGIALQMRDGSTRAVRMSEGLVFHLKQEWTPFVLSNAADVKGEDVLRILFYQDKKQMPILPTLQKALGDAAAFLHAERLAPDTLVLTPGLVSGSAMLNAVCPPSGYAAEQLTVLAGCTQMPVQRQSFCMAWCAVRKLLRKIIVKLSANSPQRAFFFRESRVQWNEESQSHKNRTEISVDSGPCLRGVRRAGVWVCRSAADRAGPCSRE